MAREQNVWNRMEPESAQLVAVPKINRERTVRAIDESHTTGPRNPSELANHSASQLISTGIGSDGIRIGDFGHTDMLDHPRGHDNLERRRGERELCGVRHDHPRRAAVFRDPAPHPI